MRFLPKLPRIRLELEGRCLDVEIALAAGFLSRLRGLILSRPLSSGEALLIRPCNSIHTFGMRHPLEAVFLSKDLRVLKISSPLKPWRAMAMCLRAWSVLEWLPGEAARHGLHEGVQLKYSDRKASLPGERPQ